MCGDPQYVISFQIRIGEWKLKSDEEKTQDFKIAEVYVHEKWDIRTLNQGYDVALIKLDKPIDLSGWLYHWDKVT